jgi:hypothetical protein
MNEIDHELSSFFDLLQIEDSTYRSSTYLMFLLSKQFNETYTIDKIITQKLDSRITESNYIILELTHKKPLRKYCILRLDSMYYIPNNTLTYPKYIKNIKGGTIHINHHSSINCFIFETEFKITTNLWTKEDIENTTNTDLIRLEQYLIEIISLYLDTKRNNNIQFRHIIALRDTPEEDIKTKHDEPTIYTFSINQLTPEGIENSITNNITPEDFIKTIPEPKIRKRAYNIITQFVENNIPEDEIELLLQSEDSVFEDSDTEHESEIELEHQHKTKTENDRKTSISPSFQSTKIFNF